MALSGTLETFALPDVLRILASTRKTGTLAVQGDTASGRLWLDEGAVVGAAIDGGPGATLDVDGVVVALLRCVDGSFGFDITVEDPDEAVEARPVDDLLAAAQTLIDEWHEVESVIPSTNVRVRLCEDLADDVIVTPDTWRVLARIGDGSIVATLGDDLGLGALDTSRAVRDLVVAGLVEIDERDPAAVMAARVGRLSSGGAGAEAARTLPAFDPPAFAQSTIGADDWVPPEPLGPDAVTADPWAQDLPLSVPEPTVAADLSVALPTPVAGCPEVESPVVESPVVESPVVESPVVESPESSNVSDPADAGPADADADAEPADVGPDDFLCRLRTAMPGTPAATLPTSSSDPAPDFLASLVPGSQAGGPSVDAAALPTVADDTTSGDDTADDDQAGDADRRPVFSRSRLLDYLTTATQ